MASLSYREIGIKKTGRIVEVPRNPYAKLMYYLSCVGILIKYDFNERLIDYEHYYTLTEKEKKNIKSLAFLLTPNILLSANIMINKPELCEDCLNQFYEITDTRLGFHTNNVISIGGIAVKVNKIMAFKRDWIEENYYEPLTEIQEIERKEKILYLPQMNYSDNDESRDSIPNFSKRKSLKERKENNHCCYLW